MWKTPRRHSVDSADSSARHSADSDIVVSPLRGLRPHCLANLRTWTSSHCHSTYLDLVTMSRRRATTLWTPASTHHHSSDSSLRHFADSAIIASSLCRLVHHSLITPRTPTSLRRHSVDSILVASPLCGLRPRRVVTLSTRPCHSTDLDFVASPLRGFRPRHLATP